MRIRPLSRLSLAVASALLISVGAPAAAWAAEGSGACDSAETPGATRQDGLSGLRGALFVIGAHVLNAVSESPAYPTDDAARAKEAERIDRELLSKARRFDDAQRATLSDLRGTGVDDVDLFHGSHVVVRDGGALYEKWVARGARPRTSSHYPGVGTQQHEIAFPKMGVLLFGKTAAGDTWFQTEAHADDAGLEWVLHRLDYVKHKGFGFVNVGPMGLSPHSEKKGRELVVEPRP